MPYKVEIVGNREYILIDHHGVATLSEVDELRRIVYELAEKEAISRVVVDVRGITNSFSTVEFFNLTEKHAAYPTPMPKPRCALISRPDQLSDTKFIEDVAMNRSLPVRAFTDVEEAMKWLLN